MFIMIGSYYCDPSVPGQNCTGVCSGGVNKGQTCGGGHGDLLAGSNADADCPTTQCVATQPAACGGTSSSTGMWCATGRNRCQSCTDGYRLRHRHLPPVHQQLRSSANA